MNKYFSPRWLKILWISGTISLAFIVYIYLLDQYAIPSSIRYFLLFSLSLAFSASLFFIIFRQADKLKEEIEGREQSRFREMLTSHMIQAQEEERKRLSRELHDGIGQSIFSVLLGIEMIQAALKEEQGNQHLEQLRRTAKQTLEEIRNMAVELRPSVLDDLGLFAALKSYIKTFSDTFGIQITFEFKGDKERLPSSLETALYRITQEALTNAAKYADTDRVDITLRKEGKEIFLSVMDYGKGFLMEEIRQRGKGVGLYGMEERTSMLGGTFNIVSKLGQGTEVKVCIPMEKEGDEK